ncbi:hypothetical protein [Cupriavidus oxalaticus]|uniref:Myb-like domain-containing protein n=1 Tax=Cupriavidus oxalaticus TaxID=96344 RepID=A0A5P3VLT2_9BURK|nr:hypothetical protein [Cupriavidus oxalaticus]QEZ47197.1 hypothetical protein D2917_23905 [Cupriavidus oxalaticus]
MARRWTQDEEAMLISLTRSDLSWRVIGAHLNRSAEAVQVKAKSLKLGPKPYTGNKSPTWSLVIQICADGRARTVHELAKLTGTSRISLDRILKDRAEAGLAHVAAWQRRWGPPTPLWLPEPGKNAAKPKARTHCQRERDRMRRMKEDDPLRYKAIIDRASARRAMRKGKVAQQHPLVQALFGMVVTA